MENIEKLQSIFERHETLKALGLSLIETHAMEWLTLQDDISDILKEFESEYEEEEIGLKLDRSNKAQEIKDEHSNADKLRMALDKHFIERIKSQAQLKVSIDHIKRKYSSLWKYHDMAKKIVYK